MAKYDGAECFLEWLFYWSLIWGFTLAGPMVVLGALVLALLELCGVLPIVLK